MKNGNLEGPAAFLAAAGTLVRCKDLGELAKAAADLTRKALHAEQACVLLRSADGDFLGGGTFSSDDGSANGLEEWVQDLLREGRPTQMVSSGGHRAVAIESAESAGVRGVVAASGSRSSAQQVEEILSGLAHLVSSCAEQLALRVREAQALEEAQASIAKGLHDLRTPLNSLRLGMHLLSPGLSSQDPAVVNRTHRAIDRMAALVTEMFDSLHRRE